MKIKSFIMQINTAGGQVPEWTPVLPAGELSTPDGARWLVDDRSMELILAAFKRRRLDLVIDYEHKGHMTHDPNPAAGWIKELQARPDGVWGRVEWTERARQMLAAKEYRYLSPVIMIEKATGRVTSITDAALTNTPRIDGFPAIVNKQTQDGGNRMEKLLNKLRAALGLGEQAGEEEVQKATVAALNSFRAMLSGLRTLVGLPAEAEAEQVLNKVGAELNARKDQAPAIPEAVVTALGLAEGAGESEVIGAINGLAKGSEHTEQLMSRVATLEKDKADRAASDLVDRGKAQGKITPDMEGEFLDMAKSDLSKAEAFLNKLPKLVPVDPLGKGPGEIPGKGGTPSDTQLKLNSLMGVTKEAFEKHNPQGEEA